MDWVVINALSRDVERQNLNKILKDIRTAVTAAQVAATNASSIPDVVGKMVTGDTQTGITVTYDTAKKVLDFAVAGFTIALAGDVTGTATIPALGPMTIVTAIDPTKVGIGEAPVDNQFYWRSNGKWALVPAAVLNVADGGTSAALETLSAVNGDAVTLRAGMSVYLKSSGTVARADDTVKARDAIGIVGANDIGVGTSGVIVLFGELVLPTAIWDNVTGTSGGLVPKATYFVGSTLGTITTTVPSTVGFYSRVIGRALDSKTLAVQLQPIFIL